MGLFTNREVTCEIYNPANQASSSTVTYPEEADLTLNMHIIKPSTSDLNMLAEIINTHEANPTGNYASDIYKSAKVVETVSGRIYKVINAPQYLEAVNCTKLELVEQKNG